MASIRIIAVPAGDAPTHIRQAWVGVVIPLPLEASLEPVVTQVVCERIPSGGPLWKRLFSRRNERVEEWTGYVVHWQDAVMCLEMVHAEAARWWTTNTAHIFANNPDLVFPAECCEVLPEDPVEVRALLGELPSVRVGITPALFLERAESKLDARLAISGFQKVSRVPDPETSADAVVVWSSASRNIRLRWNDHEQSIYLEADRWQGQSKAQDDWVELASSVYFNWMATEYWVEELSVRMCAALDVHLDAGHDS